MASPRRMPYNGIPSASAFRKAMRQNRQFVSRRKEFRTTEFIVNGMNSVLRRATAHARVSPVVTQCSRAGTNKGNRSLRVVIEEDAAKYSSEKGAARGSKSSRISCGTGKLRQNSLFLGLTMRGVPAVCCLSSTPYPTFVTIDRKVGGYCPDCLITHRDRSAHGRFSRPVPRRRGSELD